MASSGEAPTASTRQIDTPRVYREEKLPKALPWETVQAFLRAIDRTTPSGIRDYAIFLLIATYGLRGVRHCGTHAGRRGMAGQTPPYPAAQDRTTALVAPH